MKSRAELESRIAELEAVTASVRRLASRNMAADRNELPAVFRQIIGLLASPPPTVEASAQPAPGGVERCGYLIRDGQTTIGACQLPTGHAGEHMRGLLCEEVYCHLERGHDGPCADGDPTPADQPHPAPWLTDGLREAANASPEMVTRVAAHPSGYLPRPDYVTRGELVEVLRESHYDGLANRLEKARKP